MQPLRVFIGYDEREPLALEVCAHSINRRASGPVTFCPINVNHLKGIYTRGPNGTTAFSLTRFLVPYLSDYEGFSLFLDCDMICRVDIWELISATGVGRSIVVDDEYKAVWCCQHDYVPRAGPKATGTINQSYPRKNWSSFMLFDNEHRACHRLTPDYVNTASPAELHRFAWAQDKDVGALSLDWNWLVGEYPKNPDAKVIHYTLGTPCFADYSDCDHADLWFDELASMNAPMDWWIRNGPFAKGRGFQPLSKTYPYCSSKVYPLGNPGA